MKENRKDSTSSDVASGGRPPTYTLVSPYGGILGGDEVRGDGEWRRYTWNERASEYLEQAGASSSDYF